MNGDRLRTALDGARSDVEAGLGEAEVELRELERRREELLALIAQARAALGMAAPSNLQTARRGLTLHDAIAVVLRERGNAWMTAKEIAREINERRLYNKRDGSPLELNQIHARTKNYAQMFEKDGSRIRLQQPVGGP